ncbi:MAG: Undecaprenyl-diphosphatase [Holosporales bacterium]
MSLYFILVCLVQAITEYIPVSSTAHMLMLDVLFDIRNNNLVLHVGLHLGTLLSVLVFYFKDIFRILLATVTGLLQLNKRKNPLFKLGLCLIIATCPAIIIGYIIKPYMVHIHNNFEVIALSSILFGGLMAFTDYQNPEAEKNITVRHAFLIGLGQLFAFIPGGSRLGTTVTICRILGFSRTIAFRFSMLLSLPVVFGAVVLTSLDAYKQGLLFCCDQLLYVVGLTFIMGLLSLSIMDRYISRIGFAGFGLYRIILGIIIFIFLYF